MIPHVERSRPPGRNDQCPCGSGKKYKRCCLLHETSIAPEMHLSDVIAHLREADESGDRHVGIEILEQARTTIRVPEIETLLVERYLELPVEQAEVQLRQWWEQEHDRFSGAGLAQVMASQDRKEEALTILNESQGAEAWPEYWHLLSTLREEQGDTEAAVAAMELYTRLCPEDSAAWMLLADMQQRANLNDRALVSLRRAGELAPGRMLPRLLRAQILSEEGRWREVRDLCESLLAQEPDDAIPAMLYALRDLLAQSYFVLGDFDAARGLRESQLNVEPDDREARFRLAHLEATVGRYRRALLVLEPYPIDDLEMRVLDIRLRSLLALHEYGEAMSVAADLETVDPTIQVVPLVQAAQAAARKEYTWALEQLEGKPAERYKDLWYNLRLECMAHANSWSDILSVLKAIDQPDDALLLRTALAAMACGKLDVAERLTERIDDQQSMEARSLSTLLGPLRQYRRASEVRREQQVDQVEKQRRASENRDLRRQVHETERQNSLLARALADSEATVKRLFSLIGPSSAGVGAASWEVQLHEIAARAHRDVVSQERQQAESQLRAMLGQRGWARLSESVRTSLREGERLFVSTDDERDYGSALMGYARGLESAFKEAIFGPARDQWQREPGLVARLQDEGHDPSLGPLVRYLLQGGHLTLGSMAAALDRMGDARRNGVAVGLLRQITRVRPYDERALADWKRTAERLNGAAYARNRPAHAAAVSCEEVRAFRELVLGTDGLLRELSDM